MSASTNPSAQARGSHSQRCQPDQRADIPVAISFALQAGRSGRAPGPGSRAGPVTVTPGRGPAPRGGRDVAGMSGPLSHPGAGARCLALVTGVFVIAVGRLSGRESTVTAPPELGAAALDDLHDR